MVATVLRALNGQLAGGGTIERDVENTAHNSTQRKVLLTVPEAMELLRVGRTSFYRLMREEPELRPIRIGRIVRLRASDIDRWIERKADEAQ